MRMTRGVFFTGIAAEIWIAGASWFFLHYEAAKICSSEVHPGRSDITVENPRSFRDSGLWLLILFNPPN